MKKIFITVLILVSSSICSNAQESATGELIILIKNNPTGKLVRVDVDLVSSLCWDAWLGYPDLHDLTNEYPGSSQFTNLNDQDLNWEACWSYPGYEHGFGLGQYKVSALVYEQDRYVLQRDFYIDYRTSDLPEHYNGTVSGDVTVDFNVGTSKFYYHKTQTEFPLNTSIWELKEWIDSITTELEPLPPMNLVQTASTGHPVLEWQHASVTPNWRTGYKIYRSLNTSNNFVVIGSVSANANIFVDNAIMMGGGNPAYYKLTAINGTRESAFSNTIEVITNMSQKRELREKIEKKLDYYLNQNFPNPFNSQTTIVFSLKENSFVTLKVFDILGKEVESIVNGVLNSGNHQVEFDASNLESGIYFYEIRANNFRDIKKLILLK